VKIAVPISPALAKALESDEALAHYIEDRVSAALRERLKAQWDAELKELLYGDPDAPKLAGLMRWDGEE
jgi:hypothetical protein